MGWPTPDDYDEAAQNLHHSMGDEELRTGQAALDEQQLPMVWAGNFAHVYKIRCPATGNTWALKCFTKEIRGQGDRYPRIAEALRRARLPFTVPFEYLKRGVMVRGKWFPVLKMQWIEGQTLNRFVENSLDKTGMLRQLLDWWPKLAARVREAGIAHADLQHGNVLLVPMPQGQLAIKLIDYDGMYVPALAGTKSGELGHAAYQHPQRVRERTYSADVDRFSHLVIYTAVHCLKSGGRDLWRAFNNDENLLFCEADFRAPGASTLFQSLWNLGDEQARAMVGRLMLACGQRLEEVPWLDNLVVKGRVQPLTRKEERQVAEMLAVGRATAALPATVGGAASSAQPPPLPLERPEPATNTAETRPATAEGTVPATIPLGSRLRAVGESLVGGLAAASRPLDRLFRHLVGEENDILRYFLWGVFPLLLIVAVWAGIWALTSSPAPWKLRPIAPQTVEAGNELSVVVSVGNADQWKGKLRFRIGPNVPAGAAIDPWGKFTWTPSVDQVPRKYDVGISVEGPEGQKDQTTLTITVIKQSPVAPHELAPREKETTFVVAPGVKLELVLIPAGSFMMGDDEKGFNDEKPVHKVTITKPFYLGKYEVTQEQWQAVMGSNPSLFKGPKNPVEQVSWDDCQAFLGNLNAKAGRQGGKFVTSGLDWLEQSAARLEGSKTSAVAQAPQPKTSGFDWLEQSNAKAGRQGGKFVLPTEAQWEYACRAGSTSRWCFGDEESNLAEYAWYGGNSGSRTHPVGEKKPNAWGLYDMHGNVWEWCADWRSREYYARSPTDDPTGPTGGPYRVNRGGSWRFAAGLCHSARRGGYSPGYGNLYLGFRVSRVAD